MHNWIFAEYDRGLPIANVTIPTSRLKQWGLKCTDIQAPEALAQCLLSKFSEATNWPANAIIVRLFMLPNMDAMCAMIMSGEIARNEEGGFVPELELIFEEQPCSPASLSV